jgi:hypothetical protein
VAKVDDREEEVGSPVGGLERRGWRGFAGAS